jgi:uncharacterized protein YndB with AHSA1/START domain
MVDIIHRIGIKAPLAQVYAAVSTVEGVGGWWTRETSGNSQLGATFNVRFRNPSGSEIGNMAFELTKLSQNEEVIWRCTEGPPEWLGTEVTFNLSEQGDQTIVLFGHRKWREAIEFTAHCSMKWATFLLSLRQLAETGTGTPAPNDLKIDNWN